MRHVVLVTGGARSGKSRYAEGRVLTLAPGGHSPVYIATAQAWDAEMRDRIARHQADRAGQGWRTVEAPHDLVSAIRDEASDAPILIDCLTLWLTNLMLSEQDWQAALEALGACLQQEGAPVILVTNEVGMGIVPENALARAFRDAAGRVNQHIGEIAQQVVLVVAGQPLIVKPAGR